MGGQRKKIDAVQVMQYAAMGCKITEIAALIGCSHDTIERRFRKAVEMGRQKGLGKLRSVIWKKAVVDESTEMLKFLGKNYLGMTDKVEIGSDPEKPVQIEQKIEVDYSSLSYEELEALEKITKKAIKGVQS